MHCNNTTKTAVSHSRLHVDGFINLRNATTSASDDQRKLHKRAEQSRVDSFLPFVTQRKQENYDLKDIGNMDETPVWIEMPGKSTLELKGKKEVRMMSTGHEKERITVVLSALADGTKLAPFVLLPGIRPLPKEDIPSGIQVRYCFLSPRPSPSSLSLFH